MHCSSNDYILSGGVARLLTATHVAVHRRLHEGANIRRKRLRSDQDDAAGDEAAAGDMEADDTAEPSAAGGDAVDDATEPDAAGGTTSIPADVHVRLAWVTDARTATVPVAEWQ